MPARIEGVETITAHVPPEIKERLRHQARLNRRTATQELIVVLDVHLIKMPEVPEVKAAARKKA